MSKPLTIGILSPLLGNIYFGQLVRGVQAAATRQGARTVAIQTRDAWALFGEYGRSRDFTHQLAWDHVDGWVVILDAVTPEYLSTIKQAGKPLVSISWPYPELDCPTVVPDNRGGVRDAVRHLIAHGHTRIAFAGYLGHTDIQERYEGYQAALLEHGITPDPSLFFAAADNEYVGGQGLAEDILAAGVPCTAVVAGTDQNAMSMIDRFQKAGLCVPHDLAIIGFDDMESAQYTVPALTTVRQRFHTLGQHAAELLLAKLAGEMVASGPHLVPCTLIPRRSCGCSLTKTLLPASNCAPDRPWQDQLIERLIELALYPVQPCEGACASEIWPGAVQLAQGLAAAIAGGEGPSDTAMAQAWQEAIALTTDLRTLRAMNALLAEAARPYLQSADEAAREPIELFLETAQSDMMLARLRAEVARSSHFESILRHSYDITQEVLSIDAGDARKLEWMHLTPAAQSCLGLWTADGTMLSLAGEFQREASQPTNLGELHPARSFPPQALLETAAQRPDQAILMLFPVRTPQHDWGFLTVIGPIEHLLESGRSIFSLSAALLHIALDRDALLRSLEEQRASLQESVAREQALASTVREIGLPVIPLLPHVLLIPLIGTIDASRAHQLIEATLEGISQHQATEMLLDLTGVPLVDTQVAGALIQVTRAAMLLGAAVSLVGVRPEIAQSLVSLGIDLTFIRTQPTLSSAVEQLMRQRMSTRLPGYERTFTFSSM